MAASAECRRSLFEVGGTQMMLDCIQMKPVANIKHDTTLGISGENAENRMCIVCYKKFGGAEVSCAVSAKKITIELILDDVWQPRSSKCF
jgi:hypothetical protein